MPPAPARSTPKPGRHIHPNHAPGPARVPGQPLTANARRSFGEGIRNAGLYNAIWQAFAVLLPVRTVGVMGDARSYDFV